MNFQELINGKNNILSESIKKKLKDLLETEKKYLYELFDCKEQIEKEKFALKVCDKTGDALYKELEKTEEELFSQFYTRYCKGSITDKKSKDLVLNLLKEKNIDFGSYEKIEDEVRLAFSKLIFENIDKKDILGLLGGDASENESFLKLISEYLDSYLESLYNYIKSVFSKVSVGEISSIVKGCPSLNEYEEKPDGLERFLRNNKDSLLDEDILHRFFVYGNYYDKIVDFISEYLAQQGNFDFDSMVESISIGVLENLNFSNVLDEYLNFFLNKMNCFEALGDDEKECISNLFSQVRLLFLDCFGSFDDEKNVVESMNFEPIKASTKKGLVSIINQNISKLLNRSEGERYNDLVDNNDEEDVFQYIEELYKQNKYKDKIFGYRRDFFINKFKNSLFENSLFEISEERKSEIFSELHKKYFKAKGDATNITAKKIGEIKKDFVSRRSNELKDKLLLSIKTNRENFNKLDLRDLLFIASLFVYFLDDELKNSIRQEYLNAFTDAFEKRFKESHDKVVEKEKKEWEKQKAKEDKKVLEQKLLEEKQQKGREKENSTKVEQTQRREELSAKLLDDLNFYFTNIDINHSEEERIAIIRDIEKLPRKTYKRKWFKDYELNDIFFQNLDNNGYQCIDEDDHVDGVDDIADIDESDVNSKNDGQNESSNNIDDAMQKLDGILHSLNSLESNEEKVDCYIKAFELFYDVRDKNYIKSQILNSIKPDGRILKGIESILKRIYNGKREVMRKMDRSKKRYYRFDVGYNTGYRLVLNGQKGKSRRIIIDFVDHDTYEDRIPSYYCKY